MPCSQINMETTGNGDAEHSLQNIARTHHESIVSLLLKIQKGQELQEKNLKFIKHLECLKPNKSRSTSLGRGWINGFKENNYLALSYTWKPSDYEDKTSGRYWIQSRDQHNFYPSTVRNCVFDRVLNYMETFHVKFLWIDRHSIKQPRCKNPTCKHKICHQKRKAVQTMDLVYKLSKHPVALLGRPIRSSRKLDLLARLLKGGFVEADDSEAYLLSTRTSLADTDDLLELLCKITDDLWWKRAWTFQENYKLART